MHYFLLLWIYSFFGTFGCFGMSLSDKLNDSFITTHQRVRRVVGGFPSDIRSLPYVVNIRKNGVFVCGGSLLTPLCVLTAAHCIKNAKPAEFTVRGGVTFLTDARNSRAVQTIYLPKIYNSSSLENDISLLRLKLPLRGPSIGTIRLSMELPLPGSFVQVTGWGLTSANALEPSNQLRSVYVKVMGQENCQRLYEGYRKITDAMFCASIPGRRDACSADSGGPAVANGRLVGIVSWGKAHRCADAKAPGVYVNVVRLRSWIESTLLRYF